MNWVFRVDPQSLQLRDPKYPRASVTGISGQGMAPTIREGDLLVIDPDVSAKDGDVVEVRMKDGVSMIARLRNGASAPSLIGDNPLSNIVPLGRADRVAGVVIAFFREFTLARELPANSNVVRFPSGN